MAAISDSRTSSNGKIVSSFIGGSEHGQASTSNSKPWDPFDKKVYSSSRWEEIGMSKSESSASPKHAWANNSLRFGLQFDDSGGDAAGES